MTKLVATLAHYEKALVCTQTGLWTQSCLLYQVVKEFSSEFDYVGLYEKYSGEFLEDGGNIRLYITRLRDGTPYHFDLAGNRLASIFDLIDRHEELLRMLPYEFQLIKGMP